MILSDYTYIIRIIFEYAIGIVFAIFLISKIKAKFWKTNFSSGWAGAIFAFTISSSIFLYYIFTAQGINVLVPFLSGIVIIPIASLIGALIFISIGLAKRKTESFETTQQFVSTSDSKNPIPEIKQTYFDYKLASFGQRLIAFILEKIIIIVPILIIFGNDVMDMFYGFVSPYYISFVATGFLSVILSAMVYPYWGGNIGHKIMGLKVISSIDGSDFKTTDGGLKREFIKAILSLIILPLFWLVGQKNKQNLYDKGSKTLVVKRQEAFKTKVIAIRLAIMVFVILSGYFQYSFYAVLHPFSNRNIEGRWNGIVWEQRVNITFSKNDTVYNNGMFSLPTYSYKIDSTSYPFSIEFFPTSISSQTYKQDTDDAFTRKLTFINNSLIELSDDQNSIKLVRNIDEKNFFAFTLPKRTNHLISPENKISDDELKQFWIRNIHPIVNLNIGSIISQTASTYLNTYFYNTHLENHQDSLEVIKNVFPDDFRAGLKDLDYTYINQLQTDDNQTLLVIYFLGNRYYAEGYSGFPNMHFGLIFEKVGDMWILSDMSQQMGPDSVEEISKRQNEFIESELTDIVKKSIQNQNIQAMIDLDLSKIIAQTNFPLKGNWGKTLGIKGEFVDWKKEDYIKNINKIFDIKYRDDLRYDDKKPPQVFQNSNISSIDTENNEYECDFENKTLNRLTRLTFGKVGKELKLINLEFD